MSRITPLSFFIRLALPCMLLAGCATTDSRVSLLYEPTGAARGGYGEIVLYAPQSDKTVATTRTRNELWQLGKVSDKDGKAIAKVVSSSSPDELVIDAFTQELRSSGYNPVSLGKDLSLAAQKGLQIIEVSIRLDSVHKFFSDEATCVATLTVQPIINGKSVKKLRYESEITSSRVSDREQIAADTLHKTLQNLMKKSMPDIVRIIEQK